MISLGCFGAESECVCPSQCQHTSEAGSGLKTATGLDAAPKAVADVEVMSQAKKRIYSASGMKERANKACSNTRVTLSLAFTSSKALKGRLGMWSKRAVSACFLLDG